MVNITHKSSTLRKAVAVGVLKVSKQETIDAVVGRKVPKGDVFEFSRAAGLFACKKTYEVIPDCHPLPVEYTAITHEVDGLSIIVRVEVHTIYKTGVEVEAMHGVMITALTMYDMLKPIDDAIEIISVRLEEKKGGKSDFKYAYPESIKIAVVTCSDSISKNENKSEKIIEELLKQYHLTASFNKLIPDEVEIIQSTAKLLVEKQFQLILFTGGTGLSPRDVTPDAIQPLLEKEVPGIMEVVRDYGQQRTPYAMLSRGVAGFIGDTLVITLPGSPKGVEESMQALFPQILHIFKVREGVRHD
nr:bifunctional molybdenum cofactor biosynthesis protein MoaC/MoaB [uncultured Flavobacterium sp.]